MAGRVRMDKPAWGRSREVSHAAPGGPSLESSRLSRWAAWRRDLVDHVTAQRMSLRQTRMVEFAKLLHAQAFHQSPRGRVRRYREAHHPVQSEIVEGELQGGFRRLPG